MLSLRSIASIDIPNYTDSNDLYAYAADITHWIKKHEMKKQTYSATKTTHLYLDHLKENHYQPAVATCQTILANAVGDPPLMYLVPTITTTISHLVKPMPTQIGLNRPTHIYCINALRYYNSCSLSPGWEGKPFFCPFFRVGGGRSPISNDRAPEPNKQKRGI